MTQTNQKVFTANQPKTLPNFNKDYEITIADSLVRVQALRPMWEALLSRKAAAHPNGEIDLYLHNLNGARPYVIMLHRQGRPEAILLGRVEKRILDCKLGYLNLIKPPVKMLLISYNGFLGHQTPQLCQAFYHHLNRLLKKHAFDTIEFEFLSTESRLYRTLQTVPGFLTRGHFSKIQSHWRMAVPPYIEHFYKRLTKKHRYNLQRMARMLENQHRVSVVSYHTAADLDEAIACADRNHSENLSVRTRLGLQ